MSIQIKKLSKFFGNKVVLKDLSLDLNSGESWVILGQSGTGKSVLLQCIAGLMYPDYGQILINGQNICKTNIFIPRGDDEVKIGMLFQNSALFDSLKVWENITFEMYQDTDIERKKIAQEMLHLVNLEDEVMDLYPAEISGGMQKRISLARTIVSKPELILFDEPTTGLDPIIANIINDLIIKTIKYLKATAITVTHDLNTVQKVANKIAFMQEHKIYWHGTLAEFNATKDSAISHFING